jgi:hypothetical protein
LIGLGGRGISDVIYTGGPRQSPAVSSKSAQNPSPKPELAKPEDEAFLAVPKHTSSFLVKLVNDIYIKISIMNTCGDIECLCSRDIEW